MFYPYNYEYHGAVHLGLIVLTFKIAKLLFLDENFFFRVTLIVLNNRNACWMTVKIISQVIMKLFYSTLNATLMLSLSQLAAWCLVISQKSFL